MRVILAGTFQDLRYSLRALRQNLLYATIGVLSLSLGIGANIAVFSLANAILFRPLAVLEPDRLVALYNRNIHEPERYSSSSLPDFRYFREHTQTLEGLAAYVRVPFPVRLGEGAERISGELVSDGYFQILGVQAALGRVFLEEEGKTPASSAVAVISDSLWRETFGADPSVTGRAIQVGTRIFTIVGVLPRDFRSVLLDWGEPPDLWIPLAAYREAVPVFANVEPEQNRGMHWLILAGRLKADRTATEAQAELSTLLRQLPPPESEAAHWEPFVVPLQQARFWIGKRESVILLLASLAGIAGLVLLIALLNLGNLTLARTAAREKEFGMRLALGAGRGQLIRLLIAENTLLSALASIGSAAVAFWMLRLLLSFGRPFAFQTSFDMQPDLRVVGFSVLLLFAAGSVLSLLAARPLWRLDVNDALKNTVGGPIPRFDLRRTLVVAQVALSTVLVAATGQFVRTLENARSDGRTPGAGNVLLAKLDLALPQYEAEQGRAALTRMLEHVRSIAGVRSAGLVWIVPLSVL
ncbi:MAG: ABC transporter permease, partial [Bryobacteraceae bacterium]